MYFNVSYLAICITFTLIQYIIRYHDKGSIINSNEHAHTFTGAQGSIFFWFILHVLQWKTNRKETDVLQCAHDSKNSVITILTFAWPRLTVREVRLTQDVKTSFVYKYSCWIKNRKSVLRGSKIIDFSSIAMTLCEIVQSEQSKLDFLIYRP